MKHASSESTLETLTILDLPDLLIKLFAHTQRPLLAGEEGEAGLFVRYLRRKPGRGLAIIYHVDSCTSKKKQSNDPKNAVSLTLGERALEGTRILFTGEQVEQTTLKLLPSGVLHLPEMDLAVQKFPSDAGLLALEASCNTSFQSELFVALQAAANIQLQESNWRLLSAQAEPVRYKPGSRCVIRYKLQLEHLVSQEPREFTIFGKVYADAQQAHEVQELQQQLYAEQVQKAQTPFLPQPLGLLEQLGLTLNEAIQPGEQGIEEGRWAGMRTGSKALQPRIERGRSGQIIDIEIPEEELRLTAEALARLHGSLVVPGGKGPRSGTKEAKRVRERATLIASRNQAQAERIQELAEWLGLRLTDLEPELYRPAHGGFKASQLLFHSHQVFVVDFDGFCLADPALDVGYFLAYLRPSGLWYQNGGMREWFEQASASFRSAYVQGMQTQGIDREVCENIVQRARSYEAALIFKIATRRANRLNSPRPQELTAMLDEIEACLSQ